MGDDMQGAGRVLLAMLAMVSAVIIAVGVYLLWRLFRDEDERP